MKLFTDKADLRDLDTAAILLIEFARRGFDLIRTLEQDLNASPEVKQVMTELLDKLEPLLDDLNLDARSIMTAEELEATDARRGYYADSSLDTGWIRNRLRNAAKVEALEALHSRHLWSLVSNERWFDLPVSDGSDDFDNGIPF